jgi:hypothetical protein
VGTASGVETYPATRLRATAEGRALRVDRARRS